MELDYNPNIAHIVYASDDKFAEILGISLISLYDKSDDLTDIFVYILDSGISNDNKHKLLSISTAYNRPQVRFINAKNINEEMSLNIKTDRGSLSQYARLFVSSSLPKDIARVLYLDCDIIVNASISKLWNLDIKEKTIAALSDVFSKYYRKNINLDKNDIMFNSGVMLVDLKKWKQHNVENRLIKFIEQHNGVIQQGDQGVLNSVLSKETYCFSPIYNSITVFYDFSYDEILIYRKPDNFFSRQEIQEAIEHPVIIHFTTSFLSERPWVKGCTHRYVNKWLEYKSLSPWTDTLLWEPKKAKGISGLYIRLSRKLPRKALVSLSGLLHAYGKPIVYFFKNWIYSK